MRIWVLGRCISADLCCLHCFDISEIYLNRSNREPQIGRVGLDQKNHNVWLEPRQIQQHFLLLTGPVCKNESAQLVSVQNVVAEISWCDWASGRLTELVLTCLASGMSFAGSRIRNAAELRSSYIILVAKCSIV